jgi:hypothetical protein
MTHRLLVVVASCWIAWRALVAAGDVLVDGPWDDVPRALLDSDEERLAAFLGSDAELFEILDASVPAGGNVVFRSPGGGYPELHLSAHLRSLLHPRTLRWVERLPKLDESTTVADVGRTFVVEYGPPEFEPPPLLEPVADRPRFRVWRTREE